MTDDIKLPEPTDGDFYWKSGSGEIFIREHDVTHWQRTGLVRPAEPDGGAV